MKQLKEIDLFEAGAGVDSYLIKDAEDLMYLSKNSALWDKSFIYYLEANLNLQGYEFTPIGDASSLFKGFFEGNGCEIRNLTISLPQTQGVGLFGYVDENTEIESVILVNANITGADGCGAVCGCNAGGKIRWCEVESSTIKGIDDMPQEDLSIGICVGANYDNGLVYGCIGNAKLITPYKEYETEEEEDIVGFNNANFVA